MKNIILIAIILSCYKSSYCCTCGGKIGKQSAKRVFAGEVTNIKTSKGYSYVTFKIHNTLKGFSSKKVTIKTLAHSASCGFHFILNQKYMVYSGQKRTVNLCSHTKQINDYGSNNIILEDDIPSGF